MKEKKQCIEDVEESVQKTVDAETTEKYYSDVADVISPASCLVPVKINGKLYPCGHCWVCKNAMSKTKIRLLKKT